MRVILILEAQTKDLIFVSPNDYMQQISTEIDNVLENLHIVNKVFINANLNFGDIFWKLKSANSDLLNQKEGLNISLKDGGKYSTFFLFFYMKKAPTILNTFFKYQLYCKIFLGFFRESLKRLWKMLGNNIIVISNKISNFLDGE